MSDNLEFNIVVASLIAFGLMMFSFIFVFILKYRHRQSQFDVEKKQLKLEQENELIKVELELSEELMKNISQEIHDNIGQSLSLAKLNLHALNGENYKEQSSLTSSLLTRAIADLRNLSKSLSGSYIRDIGLVAAVNREIELLNSAGKIQAELEMKIELIEISEMHEVIIFRCIQETINNCIKHAQASQLKITFDVVNHSLMILAQDNGIGMPETLNTATGIGMKSLEERTKMLGGKFSISATVGGGTMLTFEVPLKTELKN